MPTKGFKNVESNQEEAESSKISNAIPIESINFVTVSYGDYTLESLPPLPIGLFLPADDDSPAERITSYTFKPDIDTGYYSSMVGGLEEKETPSPESLVKNITAFLKRIIAKFGDYTLEQIASRLCTGIDDFIGRMWVADITTIILGARLNITNSFDFAVRAPCGCPRNKQIIDNPEELRDYHSMRDVDIKLLPESSPNPIYKVVLEKGVSDGLVKVTDFYLQPLKLHQLPKVLNKEKGQAFNVRQLIETVVAIPQSEVYGNFKNRPFCAELYNPMSVKDQKILNRALAKINFGPDLTTQLFCYHCDRNVDWQFPWPQLRYFLYNSDEYEGDE